MGLGSLASWCVRRRRVVLAAWLGFLVVLGAAVLAFRGEYAEIRDIPPGQGRASYELLSERFPLAAGDSADVVFEADRGVNDPQVKARMSAAFDEIRKIPSVLIVQSPYDNGGGRISADGKIGDALVQFRFSGRDTPVSDAKRIITIVRAANEPGLLVAVTGPAIEKAVRPKAPASEAFGVLAAMIILLIAFGSVVAMGVPIVTALFGLGTGLLGLTLLTAFMDVPNVAPQLAAMIGLGVGIDYALFIVTRYRQELERGYSVETAIRLSIMTAGRAVIFAGFTVVISMLGMFLMGLPFARGLAIGAIVAVFTVMVASITLLPAVLGFAGKNIDRLKVPGLGRNSDQQVTTWYRWSRFVQRYPWPTALVGFVVLVALAWPALSIDLGLSDNGTGPKGQITRTGYDLISKGFGPGLNGRLIITAAVDNPEGFQQMERVRSAVEQTPGVVEVTPVIRSEGGPNGGIAFFAAVPAHGPQDQRTSALVRELRNTVVPDAVAGTTLRPQVGGFTAVGVDFSDFLLGRLPVFMGTVLILSFLLLLLVFRSLLVPLKAVIMNVLSIGAAFGVVVAVFQWGWFGALVGIDRTGPIEIFAPMLLFAILFGLSMDYEVFLLSRVREEWDATGDNREAVADGLAATARVITAAAAIMIFVFLAFVLDSNRVIKIFGLGLASAIFIDATLVRMLLVPATMELLGKANWWLPGWMERILPRLHVEQADVGDLDAEERFEREHAATTNASSAE